MKTMKIRLTLIEPMLGTVPKDKDIYASYIASKAPPDKNGEGEVESVQEVEEKGWTGFHKDDDGIFIFDYMIKGFLKEAANVLKQSLKLKNLKSKVDNYVFVFPRKIHVGKKEPDGIVERPLRAMTAQGPRVALARSDYLEKGLEINCEIKVLDHHEVKEKLISKLLEYGELKGLGQFRNGSYGRFTFEVLDAE